MEEEQTNGLLGKKQDVMEEEAKIVRLDIELHKVVRSIFPGEDYTDDVRSKLADFVAVLITRYVTGLAPAFVYG